MKIHVTSDFRKKLNLKQFTFKSRGIMKFKVSYVIVIVNNKSPLLRNVDFIDFISKN